MKKFVLLLLVAMPFLAAAQEQEVNDMTTPLHLLKPEYKTPYGEVSKTEVRAALERIFRYIDAETPYRLAADGKTLER
ncbi:MAG: glycoside hydrolase family 88 protein, partial [Bacteroidaceae bacterium]|nr:glycoside hydrolase family 88 protein [Bacteroidaceae bacterium]